MVARKKKIASNKGLRIPWTAEEDEALRNAVVSNKGKNWKGVAESLQGRSRAQCAHRWQKVLNPDIKKGSWSAEEDLLLKSALELQGPGKWSRIAKIVPGRNGKQCRERWYNHLTPDVKKDPWSQEEDKLIVKVRGVLGNRWAAIARLLPGRTENAVKNRWNAKLALDVEERRKPVAVSALQCSNKRAASDAAAHKAAAKKHKIIKKGVFQKDLVSQDASLSFLASEAAKTKLSRNDYNKKGPSVDSLSTVEAIKHDEDLSANKLWQDATFSEGNFNKSTLEASKDAESEIQRLNKKRVSKSKLDWFASLSLAMGTRI